MGKARYKNRKVVADNITFDSEREYRRYCDLKLLQRSGVIRDLKVHVPYPITIAGIEIRILSTRYHKKGRHLTYEADFVYFDNDAGKEIIEDSKGHRNEVYKIKRALMRAMGHEILET